ncbi:MAG: RNA methyltransferase [Bacteroidota bacterium]
MSPQNPLIKKVMLLKEKSRERKKTGLFVLEGLREIQMAQKGAYELELLCYCAEIMGTDEFVEKFNCPITALSKSVYEKIAHRDTTEGVIALAKAKEHQLEQISLNTENPLVLVAEAPEKPGNIGALLRTADAAQVDAVFIANPKTDVYNPNIIRSSVGCVFTTKIYTGASEDIIAFLQSRNITVFCAALTASLPYVDVDFTVPSAIVVGTESTGLSPIWLTVSDQNLIIPMQGQIDSMNVSVSAAILIFEAKRQRGF